MTTALVPDHASVPTVPAATREAVLGYRRASRSDNTVRAYRASLRAFAVWLGETLALEPAEVALVPAEPELVAAFLADEARAGRSPATVALRAAAIAHAHRTAGLPSPTEAPLVRETLDGVRRTAAQAGQGPKRADPLTVERLAVVLNTLDPGTLSGLRDAALLTLGFALAARRSELVALDVDDLQDDGDGLTVTILRSKTDQTGEGAVVYVPEANHADVCAVRAVRVWLAAGGITEGALFRSTTRHGTVGTRLSDRRVDAIVKRAARHARLEGRYSAHSLRSGLVTTLGQRGRTEVETMRVSRHKSSAMVRVYTRESDAKASSPLRGAW